MGCAAMDLLYFGSVKGAFGATHQDSIDLESVDAFVIPLKHRSNTAISDQYNYSLVYCRKDIGNVLWSNHLTLQKIDDQKKSIRRVTLSPKPDLQPSRLRHFFIKSNRPIHIAKYNTFVATDDCLPMDYIDKFNQRFSGFLLRTIRGNRCLQALMHELKLSKKEQRNSSLVSLSDLHVQVFAQEKV